MVKTEIETKNPQHVPSPKGARYFFSCKEKENFIQVL
jgi:YHS domain-containing protein